MPGINLAIEKEETRYPDFFQSGMVASIIILILVLCLYGGLAFMNKKLTGEIQDVNNQYNAEYSKFLSGNANEVIDFKNRGDIAKKLLDQGYPMKNVFPQLEGSVLPMVYLNSLTYNGDTNSLSLICVTSGFENEAKQITSFQQDENFSSFSLGKSSIDPKTGMVNFSVNLKLK